MQCRDVELAIEREGLSPLPETARMHLAGCPVCRDLIADLTAIVSTAEKFPKQIEPPARVWIALRAELIAEGLIKEPALPAVIPDEPWWQGFRNLLRGRAFASAFVGLVIMAAAVFQLRKPQTPLPSAAGVAAQSVLAVSPSDPLYSSGQVIREQETALSGMLQAGTLSADRSSVDTSLQSNLKQLDEFIAECERHLKDAPNDQLAREYLAAAYQQKAELLSAMIDRGRSVN
jgi:hypothetical protein